MRLLNAKTYLFEEFDSNEIADRENGPRYAILSHTWDKGQEVTFQEWQSRDCHQKAGYKKIINTCQQALKDELPYVWVDTCCIDKQSSAELSEAINSMYAWYRGATVCYAYIGDFGLTEVDERFNNVGKSKWWTRGWTLQELLAPKEVQFFDMDWQPLFTRSSASQHISVVTGISRDILLGLVSFDSVSVATRMSWASRRKTSRVEDMAYCLMGIFSVKMPMIYGEGEQAFIRLQEEIMRYSDDQSIFAWTEPERNYSGLFARSPACFKDSAEIIPFNDFDADTPFSVNNKGLNISLHLKRVWGERYRAALCCRAKSDSHRCICIYVERCPGERNQFRRIRSHSLHRTNNRGDLQAIRVRQNPQLKDRNDLLYLELRNGPHSSQYQLVHVVPMNLDSDVSNSFFNGFSRRESTQTWVPVGMPFRWWLPKEPGNLAGVLSFEHQALGGRIHILLGSSWDIGLGFNVVSGVNCISLLAPKKDLISTEELAGLAKRFPPKEVNTSHVHNSVHLVEINTDWVCEPWGVFCFVDVKIQCLLDLPKKKRRRRRKQDWPTSTHV